MFKPKNIICSFTLAAALIAGIFLPAVSTFAANPPDTVGYTISTATDDSMNVTVTLEFDEDVYLDGEAESDFNVTVSDVSLSSGYLDYYVTDTNPGDKFIEINIYDTSSTNSATYRFHNLIITPTGSGNTLPHVKSVAYDNAAIYDLNLTNKIIPSNLGITYVSSTSSSVTYEITHKPNIRCMNWLRLKDNGNVVNCTSQLGKTIPAWANGGFVISSHYYQTSPPSVYAQEIEDAINSSTTVGIYGGYTASSTGNYITITKTSGTGSLSLEVYDYTLQ